MAGIGARSDAVVRREAADWVALVHDPDAAVDRAAFERWRAADPRHDTAYARAERAWDHAALLSQTSFGRARHLPERRRIFVRPAWRNAFAAAAMVIVVITGLFFWSPAENGRSQTATLASRIGQISKIALADGSTVTLDTNTALRVAFTAGERRLYLSRGRARFAVAHDSARPFVVSAGSGSVTARGTTFDVSVLDGRVEVALLRGAVDVRGASAGNPRPVAPVRLLPGQTLSFAGSAPLPPPVVSDQRSDQWTTGMLTFDRTRLGDAITDANRYSTAKIIVADPALADLHITGAYRVGDVGGLAASMAASLELEVASTAGGDIVLSRPPSAPLSK